MVQILDNILSILQPYGEANHFFGYTHVNLIFFFDKKDLPENISFELQKNQEVVQTGNSKDMLFNIDQIIAYLSKFMTLKIGDLIYTGTPAGVGKVEINDVLEGYLEGEKMFRVKIK